jgi:hypothetical protein
VNNLFVIGLTSLGWIQGFRFSGDENWDVVNLFRVEGNKLLRPQFACLEDLFRKEKQ